MTHKRNGRPKAIHSNRLLPSLEGDITLSFEVEKRFVVVCELYFRIRGEHLVPSPELNMDMLRWREMSCRHKRLDFRHTDAEMMSLRAVAEWTLRVNAELRNQEYQPIDWRDE